MTNKAQDNRADKATVKRRTTYVYKELLRGVRATDLVQSVSVNWGVTTRQAWNYVRRANTIIKKEAQKVRASAFSYHLLARQLLRKEADEMGDRRLVLDILKDEAKLLDLYPSTKVQIEPWKSEIIDLLVRGVVTPKQVQDELGVELATELFESVGLVVIESGKADTASQDDGKY
jgi:hypothetical protein